MRINVLQTLGIFGAMAVLAAPAVAGGGGMSGNQGATSQQQYKVVPVPQGGMQASQNHTLVGDTVTDKDGQNIGTLNSIIIDTQSGNVIAGVIKLTLPEGRSALEPIPWKNFEIHPESTQVSLKQSLKEILPTGAKPYLREIVKGIEEQEGQSR